MQRMLLCIFWQLLTKASAILDVQFWNDSRFSIFVKLEKIEYLANFKYLFLKGNTPSQIKEELDSVLDDSYVMFRHENITLIKK